MTDVYTTGKTLEQITQECEELTSTPKLNLKADGTAPSAPDINNVIAYRWLNDILRELYLMHDWPFNLKISTIALPKGSRSVNVPARFWRIAFDQGIVLLDVNIRNPLNGVDRQLFFHTMTDNDNVGMPRKYFIDRASNGNIIFVDPIPDRNLFLELHNYELPAELTDRTFIPVFPHHDYLVIALWVRYLLRDDDPRAMQQEQRRSNMLAEIRKTAQMPRESLPVVELDANVFVSGGQPWDYE